MQLSRPRARVALRAMASIALAAGLSAGEVGAIPAFSRKYRTSCNTCHVAYPKLNDFGLAFHRNGFQFPRDDDFFVKDQPVTMAARAWRDLWPDALWPSDLPNLPPVSFRASMGMDQEEGAEVKGDMRAPIDVNILAGGTIGRDISFFFHQGGGIRYYVQFSNLFEDGLRDQLLPRYALNAKLGLFEPELLPLSNARRLSVTPLLAHTYTYSRRGEAGNAFQIDRQIGVELHGNLWHRLRYVIGLVNGSGDGPANNNVKDIYGRLAFKVGGMRFTGEEPDDEDEEEPEGDPLFRADANMDNSLTLGASFWLGRYTAFDSSRSESYDIDFKRVGLDARFNLWHFDLVGGVLHGLDENGLNENFDITSTVYYCALDAIPWPWLIWSGRYEKVRFGGPGTRALADQEISRFILTANALIRANLKFAVEGRFNEYLGLPGTGRDALLLRLDYSF